MRLQTTWDNQVLRPGDPVPASVPESAVGRWLDRGIAERTNKKSAAQTGDPKPAKPPKRKFEAKEEQQTAAPQEE